MNQAVGQTVLDFYKQRYPIAKARTDDVVQSHAAADRMNRTNSATRQGIQVLRALKLHGDQTAKFLDSVMMTVNINWDGWAHRRMPELVSLGYVRRYGTGRHKICSITPKGKELIKWKTK